MRTKTRGCWPGRTVPPALSAPSVPTGLVGDPSTTSVALDWNTNPEPNLASYRVYQLIAGVYTLVKTVTAPTSSTTITGLTPSTSYSFRVTAVNTVPLESAQSPTRTIITDAGSVVVPTGLFDPTGVDDISDALTAWLNDNANVPNGASVNALTRVVFPKFQPGGILPAKYRIEGGLAGAIQLSNMSNVILDGNGAAGGNGLDGAQFIQTVKLPFQPLAGAANPRGAHGTDGTTQGCPAWSSTTTYAAGAITTGSPSDGHRYKSLKAGNLNHNPAASPTWWQNIGAEGILTSTGHSFTNLIPGVDQIGILDKNDTDVYIVRTVTAINVGGNPRSINYSGPTIGGHTDTGWTVNPRGDWDVRYTPTNVTKLTFNGSGPGGTAYEQCAARCDTLNRVRSMFRLNKCSHIRFRGMQITGCAPHTGSVFDADVEGQDGIGFFGCIDCEVAHCTIEYVWGNGIEGNAFDNLPEYVATIGVWVHDSRLHHFGRQVASCTYGGHYIFEDCDLGPCARSLIDMEPTTNRNDAALAATVDGVYVMRCTIGKHGLGMMAAGTTAGDVRALYVADCTGYGIGTSGVSLIRGVIFENNVETDTETAPSAFDFVKGPTIAGVTFGGNNIIVRNNTNWRLSSSGVQFHDGGANGGCTNYLVTGNDFRRGGPTSPTCPQSIDNNTPSWAGSFVPFTLPIPAHALRDL